MHRPTVGVLTLAQLAAAGTDGADISIQTIYMLGCIGGASPLLMAGHRQVFDRMNKGNQNVFIYNFIVTTFHCQHCNQGGGISDMAFALVHPVVAPPLLGRGLNRPISWFTTQYANHYSTAHMNLLDRNGF